MKRVAVIGAGIAGLGAAYAMQRAGCDVVVLEQSSSVGGRMITRSQRGFTWDAGAQFMLNNYVFMKGLMSELGLRMTDHKIKPVQGVALPSGKLHMLSARNPLSVLSHPEISMTSKIGMTKVLGKALMYRKNFDFHSVEKMSFADREESLREWGDREVGSDAVNYYLSLPTTTMFFWQPEQTPWWMPVWFANLAAGWKIVVPQGGMGAVPLALANRLKVHLNSTVRRVDVNKVDNTVVVRACSAAGATDLEVDRVVLATPAPIALNLIPNPDSVLGKVRAEFLRTATYARNITTVVAYEKAPEGKAYGIGFPTSLKNDLSAIAWDHLKGPDRSPTGTGLGVLMPTDSYSKSHWDDTDDDIANDLLSASEVLYPGSPSKRLFYKTYRWEYAIPIMEPGRIRTLANVTEAGALADSPVFVCGDYLTIPSTEHALMTGYRAAEQTLSSLGVTLVEKWFI